MHLNIKSVLRRVHVSWQIAWCSTGILAGVAVAPILHNPAWAALPILLIALALLLVAVVNRALVFIVVAVLAGMMIGLWRAEGLLGNLRRYNHYYQQVATVSGKITEDVVVAGRSKQLKVAQISINGENIGGTVWASTVSDADIKRGDIVSLRGRLDEGFGSFRAVMNEAALTEAVRPIPGDVGRQVRDWFAGGVREVITEPEASLGVGYLVGQRSTLPEELDQQLRILGLTHIVVASGYNLTILVRLTRRVFARISKYLAALSASLMTGGFVLVTGFSPSMSRAALVTALSLAAWYYGRTIRPLVLLSLAAAITVLVQPAYIWGDIGWYLSFTSFAGVIILAPLMQRYFFGHRRPGTVRQIVGETVAAQLMTLPLIAFIFSQYAPLALPANLLVLPMVPAAMVLVFVAGVAALAIPPFASFVAWPAQIVLTYMTRVADWLAALPVAYGEINLGVTWLIVLYVVLAAGSWWLWRMTRYNFSRDNVVV